MTDDDPLDLQAVAADDAALELLRSGGPAEDDVLSLLRDLRLDVEADLPAAGPVGRGSTVLTVAVESATDRRIARSGAVVVALAAGVLSLGGVAAASTLAPVDSPLSGLGEAVRSVAGAVVGSITPPDRPARAGAALPSAAASPTTVPTRTAVAPSPAGAVVSAAARSQAAARQVAQLLDQASGLLAAGRTAAATSRLDLAERKLAEVLPQDREPLARRLRELRGQATAASPAPKAERTPKAKTEPKRETAPKPARQEPAKGSSRREAPPEGGKEGKGPGKSLLGQLSDSEASVKPRA